MKAIGIVRRVDEIGRVVIPSELRDVMGLESGSALEFYIDGEQIILRRYQPGCVFCENADDLIVFRSKRVCKACLDQLKGMV
jgi:transcriptional pleiotropic regulator of transition state genes